ncbi:hypothetical protein CTA2_5503 [Colletotrichum tanaceti]|uniref:Uncharacterized protein n=1 Tax=Colletotrichum tanaceti TaxID=1306861 RepID=A0A4V6DGQ5_9PEZI|nr:hypothetical protein CTA2_5503 [Colletotrichum tanaceti]TKW53616.1 hypothetical protein CTA1_10574 [Colletotrichum tanaceti]
MARMVALAQEVTLYPLTTDLSFHVRGTFSGLRNPIQSQPLHTVPGPRSVPVQVPLFLSLSHSHSLHPSPSPSLRLPVLSKSPTAGLLLASRSSLSLLLSPSPVPSSPLLCFPKTKPIIRATNLPILTLAILSTQSNHPPRRSFLCRFASIETGLYHSLNSPAISLLNVLLTTSPPPPPNPPL